MLDVLAQLATYAVLLVIVGGALFLLVAHWVHDLIGPQPLEVREPAADEIPLVRLDRSDRKAA